MTEKLSQQQNANHLHHIHHRSNKDPARPQVGHSKSNELRCKGKIKPLSAREK